MERRHTPGISRKPVGTRKHLETLLTTPEVAECLGIAQITARKWRLEGFGPRFVKVGSGVRYRASDVEAWLASRTVQSTSEAAA